MGRTAGVALMRKPGFLSMALIMLFVAIGGYIGIFSFVPRI